MRVVHEPAGDAPARRVLATEVEIADSPLSQARGLMFRRSLPDGFALVLEVGDGLFPTGPPGRAVHMLFVRVPLDVVWLVDDEVVRTARLSPWTGFGFAKADRVVELPAGGTEGVAPGDAVFLEEA
jgi:uncharacterized membrane protein (UPF0127 family)